MQIIPYDFSGKTIRFLTDEGGDPWWVATDICCALGLSNVSMAIQSLDDDERSKVSLGRQGETNIINEPGLYRLLSRSNKKRAKKFQRWVFHDVLPTIRKTGGYDVVPKVPQTYAAALRLAADQAEEIEKLKPKALVYDKVSDSTGLVNITNCAKIIDISPHTFSANLRFDKYCYISRGKMIPYQPYIDNKWFEMKLVPARDGSTSTYRQTFITPRGVNKFRGIYNPDQKQRKLFA